MEFKLPPLSPPLVEPGRFPGGYVEVELRHGATAYRFTTFNHPFAQAGVASIISGQSYPRPPFINPASAKVIVDIGANVGAASLYFAVMYPLAQIYAFEPYPDAYELLKKNLAQFPNVRVFDFGLFSRDVPDAKLFLTNLEPGTQSILQSYANKAESVPVKIRSAAAALAELGVHDIDVLKVDTEGCEYPILRALYKSAKHSWPRVIHLEYHSETDRQRIDLLLRDYLLVRSVSTEPHRGEMCYVLKSQVPAHVDSTAINLPAGWGDGDIE